MRYVLSIRSFQIIRNPSRLLFVGKPIKSNDPTLGHNIVMKELPRIEPIPYVQNL